MYKTLQTVGKSLGWADGVLDMQWGDMATQEVKDKVAKVIEELKSRKHRKPI